MSSIRQKAKALLEETGNDLNAARALVRTRADEIYREIGSDLVVAALEEALCAETRMQRSILWKRPHVLASGELSTPSRYVTGGLLSSPMSDGRPISAWSKAEIVPHAKQMIAQGDEMIVRGNWMLMIAKELKRDADVVGVVLSEADLIRLQRKAQKAAVAA